MLKSSERVEQLQAQMQERSRLARSKQARLNSLGRRLKEQTLEKRVINVPKNQLIPYWKKIVLARMRDGSIPGCHVPYLSYLFLKLEKLEIPTSKEFNAYLETKEDIEQPTYIPIKEPNLRALVRTAEDVLSASEQPETPRPTVPIDTRV